MKRVFIAHPDGREYSIEPTAFTDPRFSSQKKSYADQGFRIVSYDDGSPYDGSKTKAEIEAAAAPQVSARNVQPAKPAAVAAERGKADS